MEDAVGIVAISVSDVGIDVGGQFVERGGDDGSSRSIARTSTVLGRSDTRLDGRVAHIPVGNQIVGHIGLGHPERGNLLSLFQIGIVVGVAITHRETVEAPALSATPYRLVEETLVGDALDDTAILGIVVHHMIGRIVLAEMILHGGVGVRNGDVMIALVARDTGCFEEQFEVHHVVDDDRILPTVGRAPTPAADASHGVVVTGDERLGSLHNNVAIGLFARQFPSLAKRVIDHEAQVVASTVVLHLFDGPGVADCLLTPEGVVRILIHVPQLAAEESAAPVGLAYHTQISVLLHAAWHQRPVLTVLANLVHLFELIAKLHVSTSEGIVGEVGRIVEQEEAVGKATDDIVLGQFQVVGAIGVEQIETIEILGHLVLLVVPLADLLIGPLLDLLAHIRSQEFGSLFEQVHTLGLIACLVGQLEHVDDVRQVVLRVAKSQCAAKLVGLTAIGLDLRQHSLLVELRQIFVHHLLVAHKLGIGNDLHIVGRGVVVALVAFLDALLTGQDPMEELGEPLTERLGILGSKGLRTFEQLYGIEHLDKRVGIDHPVTASFAIEFAGHNLRMVQIGIHPRFLVQEPHLQQLGCLLGITFVAAEIPSQREGGDAVGHQRQFRAVEQFEFGIRHAIAADVGQSVGLRRVGPVVATQTQVVVLVATCRHLLLHHHRKRLALQLAFGIVDELTIGRGVGRLFQICLHLGEVAAVPNGLRPRRPSETKEEEHTN